MNNTPERDLVFLRHEEEWMLHNLRSLQAWCLRKAAEADNRPESQRHTELPVEHPSRRLSYAAYRLRLAAEALL